MSQMSTLNYVTKIIFYFFLNFKKVCDIVPFLLGSTINATKHVKNVSLLCPFVSICVHLFKNTKKTKMLITYMII